VERLQRTVEALDDLASDPLQVAPLARLDWPEIRDAIGLETAVIIELLGQHLFAWTRDAIVAQATENREK